MPTTGAKDRAIGNSCCGGTHIPTIFHTITHASAAAWNGHNPRTNSRRETERKREITNRLSVKPQNQTQSPTHPSFPISLSLSPLSADLASHASSFLEHSKSYPGPSTASHQLLDAKRTTWKHDFKSFLHLHRQPPAIACRPSLDSR
jgi:hypothetical protein